MQVSIVVRKIPGFEDKCGTNSGGCLGGAFVSLEFFAEFNS